MIVVDSNHLDKKTTEEAFRRMVPWNWKEEDLRSSLKNSDGDDIVYRHSLQSPQYEYPGREKKKRENFFIKKTVIPVPRLGK